MKTVVLFGRRNVGLCALSYLVAQGLVVKVVSDDKDILWMAFVLGCEIVTMEEMGEHDLLLSVHWNKIISKEYLNGVCINIHPLLHLGDRYKGHNPVRKFIESNETVGGVSAHHMTEIADEGEVIATETFHTGSIETYEAFYNIALPFYFKLLDRTLKIVL